MHFAPGQRWLDIQEIIYSTVQRRSVGGTSSSDVWASGTQPNQIVHYDGTEWTAFDETDDMSRGMEKIWALGPDDVWGVGAFGAIQHFAGTHWTQFDVRVDDGLRGLWMSPSGEGWAAGDGGAIMHRVP